MSSASQKSSAEFSEARLLVSDFDGTMFDTFEPSPNGIGVNEAYRLAIEAVFDFDSTALERYQADGEHQNRTPTEIAHSLMPNATREGVKRIAGQLVAAKLDILLEQIGQPLTDGALWPRTVPGFADFWSTLTAKRKAGQQVSTAIISAGHAEFMQKSFEIAGLEMPDFMVTDETVRSLYSALPVHKLTKPSILPMDIIRAQWLSLYCDSEEEKQALEPESINERIVYLGDDPNKDAALAMNAGVRFVYIHGADRRAARAAWKSMKARLELGLIAVEGARQ